MNVPDKNLKPVFLSLDGIDGVGKSTQIERLQEHLKTLGHEVVCVRDPGGTELGSQLRKILLESDTQMHRRTEAMLFMASRSELIETIIKPALAAGKSVLSDRFLLANVVYQSVGGDVTAEHLWQVGNWATGGLQPDLTILLDMPAGAAIQRFDQPADRMEARGVDYLESVRKAFLEQLPHSSPHTAVVDADQTPADVSHELLRHVDAFLSDTTHQRG